MKNRRHLDKAEKRRLLFNRKYVISEKNKATYGAGSGAAVVVGKTVELNKRLLAALLALVFVLTTLVVGVNVATKAQGAKDEQDYGMMETVDPETGMVLRKGYVQTKGQGTETLDDDEYSLKLEAYATTDTTKTPFDKNDTKTPLDIVMVMNQTESMVDNKDVLKGKDFYQPANKDFFTIADVDTGDYYYLDENNVPRKVEVSKRVDSVEESYVLAKHVGDSNVATSWTAQQAANWMRNAANSGKHLFFKNTNDVYDTVDPQQVEWYKNAGEIPAENFQSSNKWYYYTNNPDLKIDYYYNSEGDISKNKPFWHRVFENTEGVTTDGFYIYLWYYTGGERTFASGKTLESKQIGGRVFESAKPTDEYTGALKTGTVKRVPNDNAYTRNSRKCDAWNSYTGIVGSDVNYTGGKLYLRQPASTGNNGYNRLVTKDKNTDSELQELAWPLAQTNSKSSTNPGSRIWPGEDGNPGHLYMAGYILFYTDANGNPQYIGTAVEDTDTSKAYIVEDNQNIPLYEKEKITRLEAQQLAANNFAEQLAANIGDRDYRIAVVGNAGGGTIYSGAQTADDAYVTTKEDVQSAIATLTADEKVGTALSDGLAKAADVFAANKLDPADSRKRIVIVFGDSDTWAASNDDVTRRADAVLKDTYNASVYTIGLFNGVPDANTETFLSQMSSEYFFTTEKASDPNSYKKMDGTYHYIANGNVFPDEANSMISTFGTVAAKTSGAPTTEFVLDKTTAVLKDIIHDNFNPPSGDTTIDVAVAESYNADGEPNWGIPQNSGLTPKWEGRTLTVTGFDYDANYVSKDRPTSAGKGEKLIITINGLTVNQRVRTESKSAKRIYFNGANSGIYKTGAEELLVNSFPRPFLDDKTWLAPEGGTGTKSKDGVVVNKYLTPTENGTYDLTVEAYTTQTSSTTTEKIPTDFVIVSDQSGSMSEADMPTGYKKVTETKTLEQVAEGKYYVLGDDGQYYRVYGTRNYMWRYYPANYFYVGDLIQRFSARLSWFQGPKETGTTVTNQMFFREVKDGQTYYQPITMTVQGKVGTYYIKFGFDSVKTGQHYMFDRKNTAYSSNGVSPWYKSALGNVYNSGPLYRAAHAAVSVFYDDPNAYTYSQFMGANTGMFINYPMYDRHVGYNQLLYRDANGTEHVLSATTGQTNYEFCNDSGNALTSETGKEPTYSGLYEATGNETRLKALQNALTEFAEAVASEKNSNGTPVDNKIAIVGFSSNGFNNTELLTNENYNVDFNANWKSPENSSSFEYSDNGKAHDGIQKSTADNDVTYYKEALVPAYDATTNKVSQKVTDGIRALTAHGGTQPEDGLEMAYKILENRQVTDYHVVSTNENKARHTIVIYFTDGRPGDSTTENQYGEANEVVEAALPIKRDYKNLFSIGVFGESDGNPLTYTAYKESSEKVEYEYDLGWTETFRYKDENKKEYGDYYYLNRNWRSGSPADYGATASDTIYDYMSVVSSNYPDATQYMKVKKTDPKGEADLSDGTYLTMLNHVRGTYIGNNDYYRMASNQATLVAAFQQAVTMMNETISAEQRLDASSVMQDVFNNTNFTVKDGYSIRATTVNGTMDKYGNVNFDESTEAPANGVVAKLEKTGEGQDLNQAVRVTGFDYLANYITYGYIDSDSGAEIPKHDGKKLVVTISNVVPTVTGDDFYSNIFDNNQSSIFTQTGSVKDTDFPRPHISRHKYTLDVGAVNPNATFTVAMKVLDSNGQEVAQDSSMLDDVILTYPNGNGRMYKDVGPQEFLQVGNGQSFYLENLPAGYQVETKVTSTDDAYEYFIWFDGDANQNNPKKMEKGISETKNFDYADRTIHITSKRGSKDVSVRERTIGSYGDTTHRFGEVITMEIPYVEGETLVTEFPCTFNDNFSGFESDIPSGATNYRAVFTVPNPESADTKVGTLTAIKYTKSDGTEGIWNLGDDADPVNYELPMRDGDEIIFKNVPTGNTVKAIQPEKNHFEHEVFYFYGQDDVSPSGIKLMTTNGDLLTGTHTLTFKEVEGLEKARLEVTFENGSITKVNGKTVKAGDTIDFAKYQTMYVIDEGNDDLSDAKLNIDGTEVYFSTETEDEKTAYVATIKRETFDPPVSVTVEKNNMDILIINERGDIEIEGIFDSNHHTIIYLLAGAGALALAAGGYYVWKKKDEFVEG